jgi:hypothetical protein
MVASQDERQGQKSDDISLVIGGQYDTPSLGENPVLALDQPAWIGLGGQVLESDVVE